MRDCMWCREETAVAGHEVMFEMLGSTVNPSFNVCDVCLPDAVGDGERDPDVLAVHVEALGQAVAA